MRFRSYHPSRTPGAMFKHPICFKGGKSSEPLLPVVVMHAEVNSFIVPNPLVKLFNINYSSKIASGTIRYS